MSSVVFSSLQVLRSDASHKSRLNTPDDNLLFADHPPRVARFPHCASVASPPLSRERSP
jgi:hypothetical protein